MVTWDDLAVEFYKTILALERSIRAFESLTKTYNELIKYIDNIHLGG